MRDTDVLRGMEIADHLVLYQEASAADVPEQFHEKLTVIWKSVDLEEPHPRPAPTSDRLCCTILAHLRPIKDPFRTAEAVRLLPEASRIHVTHIGEALGDDMEARARAETASNERYTWLGGVTREEALRLEARARLMVVTSEMLRRGLIEKPEDSQPQNVCTRKLWERMIINEVINQG